MAKKKRGVKRARSSKSSKKISFGRSSNSNSSGIEIGGKKKTAMNLFIWILLTAAIIYGIYHAIVIDTVEGFQIILGVIVLGVLIKIAKWLISKLRK